MKFLGTLLVFAGYVFVYASVAAGGKFATEPWASLFADAYTGAQQTGNTGAPPGYFDTPYGPRPFRPPTNLPGSGGSGVGATPGQFDTPGGTSVYKPPPGIPVAP